LRSAITEAGAGCDPLSFETSPSSEGGTSDGHNVINAFGTHDNGVDHGLSHEEQCKHQVWYHTFAANHTVTDRHCSNDCGAAQAIVFIPSHDRWSTGLKHALLCGSVVLYVENVFNSFGSMGLRPWEHYIPIAPDAATICNSIKKAMHWIEQNPDSAAQIGCVAVALGVPVQRFSHPLETYTAGKMAKRSPKSICPVMPFTPPSSSYCKVTG